MLWLFDCWPKNALVISGKYNFDFEVAAEGEIIKVGGPLVALVDYGITLSFF
jgi:hypothetical protein